MARTEIGRYAFNRGIISTLALARVDLKRYALSAEQQDNWMPRALGSMILRPGLGYLGASANNATARHITFVRELDAQAILEFTTGAMRVWIDDVLLTRPTVTSAVSNGTFTQYTTAVTITNAAPAVATYTGADNFANGDQVVFATAGTLPAPLVAGTVYYVINLNAGANTFQISATSGGAAIDTTTAGSGAHTVGTYRFITGWTDSDESGGVSAWATGGYLGLTGTGTAAAIRDQQVTVAGANISVEHALRIVIQNGPVTLKVGSSLGTDEYVTETTLETGTHSLAFTPTGDFYIRFMSRLERIVYVDSVTLEAVGVVSITSPYLAADMDYIRADLDSLSIDVMFVGCRGYQQRRVERRGTGRSWSIVLYRPPDGPFRNANVSESQTMTPSVINGNGTLTSNLAYFRSTHVGALFRLVSTGQTVAKSMTVVNDSTNSIRVTGVDNDRSFTIILSGLTATGNTVILQRSFDDVVWTAVSGKSWTVDATEAYDDGLDNQIVYYRLRCTVYAAGTTVATLSITTGSITGVGRVTARTSSTVVDIEVLVPFGATDATDDWAEGKWSDYRGWPSAGTLYDGRLWWGGMDAIIGSVSDAFDGFDPDTEGDSGPINRSIGSGPLDKINWILGLQRLVLGGQMAEHSVKSNALDEPLTPTNFNRKAPSTQGSAPVQAVKVDSRGVFVQRGGTRVYELEFDPGTYDYTAQDLTLLCPELCDARVVRMAVQRQPDTRLHFVLADGTAAVMVYDKAEKVACWVTVSCEGLVEDVVVKPGVAGQSEDQVYYSVKFTVNSATVRYLCKWALESECEGGTLNKQADAFVVFTNAPASVTVTGLTHLIGEDVVCWYDGKCEADADDEPKTYTVSGAGEITLPEAATTGVVGLGYEALYESMKLGQTLAKDQNVEKIATILKNTHAIGIYVGRDFDNMEPLPLMYQGRHVDEDEVYAEYDEPSQEIPGEWKTDSRVCLKAIAPRPATVLAAVIRGQSL